MDLYEKGKEVGRGAFGSVFAATRKSDGVKVAIKRVHDGLGTSGVDFTALREIKFLRGQSHPHVIGLLDVFSAKGKICLVYEFMVTDLFKIIQDKRFPLSAAYVKRYTMMTLQGLHHLHRQWISHRDMKPSNLLVSHDGALKISDLGMSRSWALEGELMSPHVVTRPYRAPELLYGSRLYNGAAIDVWAAACIVAEMLTRAILFNGTSDLDQLSRIFAITGVPDDDNWPQRTSLPDYLPFEATKKNQEKKAALQTLLPMASPNGVNLLAWMLSLDPRQRPSAEQCLQHPYFTEEPLPMPQDKLIPPNVFE